MLSKLNVRGGDHEKCEDSLFVVEDENSIRGGVFDGCSTGQNSHWASQTLAYLYERYARDPKVWSVVNNYTTRLVVQDLVGICQTLKKDEMHFLSTALLFEYNKESRSLYVRAFGDGSFFVDGVENTIHFPRNEPDYLGYLLRSPDYSTVSNYLDRYPIKVYPEVGGFQICTDGIEAFSISQFKDPKIIDPLALLLHPPDWGNYLARMWNKVRKDGWTLRDDLSIISYVTDKERTEAGPFQG